MNDQKTNINEDIKISVIVPAYNVEKYVGECLNSIINQTYTNLEIIIVDDGATDSTPQIVDRYAEKDNRIKVIHKPNGGLSSARNAGMKIMTGDYVSFIDSDDSIEHDTYEKVVEVIKKDKDVDFVSFFFKFSNYHEDWRDTGEIKYEYIKDILGDFIKGIGLISYNVWSKVYKREILTNMSFCEGKYFEDLPFVLEVLFNTKKVAILFRELYNYRTDNNNSISNTPSEKIFDIYYIFEELKSRYKNNQQLCNYIDMTIITQVKSTLFDFGQSDKIDILFKKKLMKKLCDIVKTKRNAPILIDSLKERLKLKSFVLFPELYAFVYRHKKYTYDK